MSMFKQHGTFAGDWINRKEIKLVNQTGAALAAGDVVAFNVTLNPDLPATASTSTNQISPNTSSTWDAYFLGNAVVAIDENIGQYHAVALETIAKGQPGRFLLEGMVTVKVDGSASANVSKAIANNTPLCVKSIGSDNTATGGARLFAPTTAAGGAVRYLNVVAIPFLTNGTTITSTGTATVHFNGVAWKSPLNIYAS